MIGIQATLGEADKEYQSIVGLVREVESIVKQHQIPGGLENPYTTLTAHVSLVRFNFLFSSSQYVEEFIKLVFIHIAIILHQFDILEFLT